MENNLLIKNNIEKVIRGEHSDFLDPSEYTYITAKLNKCNIKYKVFKPFDDCTKVIIYRDNYPGVTLVEIKTNTILKHRDILGALFSHNINISKYPETLNFWFDFLDQYGTLSQYQVPAVGDRSKVINDSSITAIYFRETPTVLFVQNEEDKIDSMGYTWV